MKKAFVFAWLIFTWVWAIEPLIADENLTSLVSKDAVIVASIKPGKDDPGVSYLASIWKETLKEREGNSTKKQEAIEDIFKQPHLPNITVAIFGKDITKLYGAGGSIFDLPSYLILVESSDKEFLKSKLDVLLEKSENLKRETFKEGEFAYNEFAGLSNDPSIYVQLGDIIAVGPGRDKLEEALELSRDSKDSIARLSKYKEMMSKMVTHGDGTLYIDNRDLAFTKMLRELEKDWKITLLLAVDYIDSMGISFDIIDKDSAKANIVFKAKDPKGIEEIKNDARFLGEAIARKFVEENVGHSSNITVSGKYVILELELKGLENIWARIFKKG